MSLAQEVQPAPGSEAPTKTTGHTLDSLVGNTPLLRLPLITKGLPGSLHSWAVRGQ